LLTGLILLTGLVRLVGRRVLRRAGGLRVADRCRLVAGSVRFDPIGGLRLVGQLRTAALRRGRVLVPGHGHTLRESALRPLCSIAGCALQVCWGLGPAEPDSQAGCATA